MQALVLPKKLNQRNSMQVYGYVYGIRVIADCGIPIVGFLDTILVFYNFYI